MPQAPARPTWQTAPPMNFARDVVDAAPPRAARARRARRATAPAASGPSARSPTAARGSPARSPRRGVDRGDVVMTLIGNRPEWVLTMVACFRIGAVALPCNEQLRAKDLRLRLAAAQPALIVADERNRAELEAAGPACEVLADPDESLFDRRARARRSTSQPTDPCLITFTSGTTGEAEGGRPRPALPPRAAAPGDRLARRARRASSSGARPPAAGPSRPATCSSRRG